MSLRVAALGAALATLAFASPVQAQSNLPPDVAQAIFELSQAVQMQCQMGDPGSCQAVQQIQQEALQLDQWALGCRQQNQQACAAYNSSVQELAVVYQQFQAAAYAQQNPQGYVSPGQHQQNMQQMQNQFNQHNENWAANQERLTQQNQQFLDGLLQ